MYKQKNKRSNVSFQIKLILKIIQPVPHKLEAIS